MRLLVVSPRSPWPPNMADSMTVDRLIRFLSARGHEVDLACYVDGPEQERGLRDAYSSVCAELAPLPLPRWRSYANTALTLAGKLPMQVQYYRSSAMRERIAELVGRRGYDLVYTHLIRMSEFTRDLRVPKVLGVQISQALNLSRMVEHTSDPLRGLFYRIESAKVRPYEAEVCADFDRVFLCGPTDIAAIEATAPVPNAVVCPHGQDVPERERIDASQRVPGAIAISGVMSTYTNVDAARWFANEIFPLVEREVPEARFWIVGRSPQRSVRALARDPQVVVTGEVPDVYDWLCRAQVAVAPLRIGAGMQNKIIQAMACELPVVSTPVANEGIGATPEDSIVLREEPEAFAAAVVELLRDDERRGNMGRSARHFVESHWTWEAHFEKLEKVLREVAGGG